MSNLGDAGLHRLPSSSSSTASSNSSDMSLRTPLEQALHMMIQQQAATEVCIHCRKPFLSGPGSSSARADKKFFCPMCNSAVYCSPEHLAADSSNHKFLCQTIVRIKEASCGGPAATAAANSGSTTSRADDTASLNSSSSGRGTSTGISAPAPARILATSDPDIQIIEGPSTRVNGALEAKPTRKRALNPNVQYKDHGKNLLYNATLQEHMKSLASSGLALTQHQAVALRLRYLAEHVIRGLNEFGWAVCDHFLGDSHVGHIFREVNAIFESGVFTAGELMDRRDNTAVPVQDIRSDRIYWYDSNKEQSRSANTVRLLICMIDSLMMHFKDRIPPYKISGRSRPMIACYPGNGTRYVKHVDNPSRDGRCITTIYYCNENWKLSEHGGTLRLYPESSEVPMDIDPQADRLVFFFSDKRNPHEVLPVFRPRYAITIWYFDHNEKMECLERRRKTQADGSPTKIRPNNEWQPGESAFKKVTASNFIPPNASSDSRGSLAGSSAMSVHSGNSFRPVVDPMRTIRTGTNSDSFSTGSVDDDNLDEANDTIRDPNPNPEYNI